MNWAHLRPVFMIVRACPKQRYYSPKFAAVRIGKVFNTAFFTAKTPFYFAWENFFTAQADTP